MVWFPNCSGCFDTVRKLVILYLPYQFYAWFFSPAQALPESVRPVAQNRQEVGFTKKIKRAYGLGNQ